ncbi:MAG: RNA polymerase sigma factor [Lachnospiraceae bacterium]|nr:RNA polymerase sigma factor [Lachnospiraceae bacterium]
MIDELYDSLYKELMGWCTAMTGNKTLAEDLVQEAFLRALLNSKLLEELDSCKRRAWMYRTVKNLYIDRKRREAFETMQEQIPQEGFEEMEYAKIDDEQLLTVLTREERILFTLRYLEGYNSAELGKLFGLPPGTVRSRLSSARKRLRQSLKED